MMDYIGLLAKIIKESGLTHEEITSRCEADGIPFNYNYISTIKNRGSIPSDDISRAIARACNRNENLLVAQAYYDKSPKGFKDMLDSIVELTKFAVTIMSMQKIDKTDVEAIRIIHKKLDEMAVGEWLESDLSDMAKKTKKIFAALTNSDEFEEMINIFAAGSEGEDVCTYIAPDDSMSPTIPEGAQIHTILISSEHLKDGDFICYSNDDDETYIIRKIEFLDDSRKKMLLIPTDKIHYRNETVDMSDNRLYGKVVQIIIDLE